MEVAVVLCKDVLEVGEAHFELSLDRATPHRNDGAAIGCGHSVREHTHPPLCVVLVVLIFCGYGVGHKSNREIGVSLTVDASLNELKVFDFHL